MILIRNFVAGRRRFAVFRASGTWIRCFRFLRRLALDIVGVRVAIRWCFGYLGLALIRVGMSFTVRRCLARRRRGFRFLWCRRHTAIAIDFLAGLVPVFAWIMPVVTMFDVVERRDNVPVVIVVAADVAVGIRMIDHIATISCGMTYGHLVVGIVIPTTAGCD